jgi:hypothetical protein
MRIANVLTAKESVVATVTPEAPVAVLHPPRCVVPPCRGRRLVRAGWDLRPP